MLAALAAMFAGGAAVFVESDKTHSGEESALFLTRFVGFSYRSAARTRARIAPWSSPTSASFADVKRVCSLLLSTARGAIRA